MLEYAFTPYRRAFEDLGLTLVNGQLTVPAGWSTRPAGLPAQGIEVLDERGIHLATLGPTQAVVVDIASVVATQIANGEPVSPALSLLTGAELRDVCIELRWRTVAAVVATFDDGQIEQSTVIVKRIDQALAELGAA